MKLLNFVKSFFAATVLFDKILENIYLNKQESLRFRAQTYTNRERTLKINQLVWLFIKATTKNHYNWHRPFSILKRIGTTCYVIQPVISQGKEIFVHATQLKECLLDISQVKKHLGIVEPNDDQEVELYHELDMINSVENQETYPTIEEENKIETDKTCQQQEDQPETGEETTSKENQNLIHHTTH